ncbi:hypothetical protein B0J15DRAFT_512602 [Fusarium solani]|uniref:Arrestin-like N-terminal domain-containing protein n=1 Tax=Fusarium solani TaxID=169388 RepID=A0A9P9KIV9_FUSSL|nr:uncharacterized protein B0J15DRAFT_512602 [Fusarium solani]KAH7258746.1 hypothetical protein B0J15DRAFT_512602 [Fusarium solani]
MPPTRALSSTELGIRLEGDQTEYAPGDTIVGYVFLSTATIICETGLSRYHGAFNLIPQHAKQKLHQGPLHLADSDKKSWRFAITIPKYVDPADFKDGDKSESYLSLEATNKLLPSTFTLFGGERTEAYVEYFVRASLRSKNENRKESWLAKLPITVTNRSDLVGSRLHTQSYFYSFMSYRLIPGMEETKLSLPQIVKQAMGISSVPRFGFNLQVDMPEVIQINDPNPIPFRLRTIVNRDFTSDEIRNNPPKIKLKWISIQIIATTEVICQGSHTMEEETEMDLDIMNQISIRGQDVYIPCTEDGSFIDIGDLIDLRLDRYYNVCPQHQGPAPFTPSFVTYNIRRSHRLKWMLAVEFAGQMIQNTETIMLTILGPSRGADGRGYWAQEEDFGTGKTPRIE